MLDDTNRTLDMLSFIERQPQASQRSMASELGIAVGMVNAYVKRCVHKGLVKVKQAPAGRYFYYLTPLGFAEKARLSAEFLSQSFRLIRAARSDYDAILAECRAKGLRRVLLAGASDLAEIAQMFAQNHGIRIVGIVDPHFAEASLGHLLVRPCIDGVDDFDVVILTDLQDPQRCFDWVNATAPGVAVLVPPMFALRPRGQDAEMVEA